MIGFLVTMENIHRNEHFTPVFKIIISNPNYWNLAADYTSTWACRLSIASEIPKMYQANLFCVFIKVKCHSSETWCGQTGPLNPI